MVIGKFVLDTSLQELPVCTDSHSSTKGRSLQQVCIYSSNTKGSTVCYGLQIDCTSNPSPVLGQVLIVEVTPEALCTMLKAGLSFLRSYRDNNCEISLQTRNEDKRGSLSSETTSPLSVHLVHQATALCRLGNLVV